MEETHDGSQRFHHRLLQYKENMEIIEKVVTKLRMTKVRSSFRIWATRVKEEEAMKIEMKTLIIEIKKIKRRKRLRAFEQARRKQRAAEIEESQAERRSLRRPRSEAYCVLARPRKTQGGVKQSAKTDGTESGAGSRCCGRDPPNVRAAKREEAKADAVENETKSFKKKAKNAKAKASAYFICSTKKAPMIRATGTPFQFGQSRKKESKVCLIIAAFDVSTSKTKFRNFTNVNGKK